MPPKSKSRNKSKTKSKPKGNVPADIRELYLRFTKLATNATAKCRRDEEALQRLQAVAEERPSPAAYLALAKCHCLRAVDAAAADNNTVPGGDDKEAAVADALVAAITAAVTGAQEHKSLQCLLLAYKLLEVMQRSELLMDERSVLIDRVRVNTGVTFSLMNNESWITRRPAAEWTPKADETIADERWGFKFEGKEDWASFVRKRTLALPQAMESVQRMMVYTMACAPVNPNKESPNQARANLERQLPTTPLPVGLAESDVLKDSDRRRLRSALDASCAAAPSASPRVHSAALVSRGGGRGKEADALGDEEKEDGGEQEGEEEEGEEEEETGAGQCSVILCASCGKSKEEAGGMKQCERCKQVGRAPAFYCSQACQYEDWAVHKLCCQPVPTSPLP